MHFIEEFFMFSCLLTFLKILPFEVQNKNALSLIINLFLFYHYSISTNFVSKCVLDYPF